jgi:hypothetical protein
MAQPVIIAAIIGALVTLLVSGLGSFLLHRQRLRFEERLAEKKFSFDTRLAERKFELDRSLSDWQRRSAFAESALADVYEAQVRMSAIRSPLSFENENSDRSGRADESEQVRQQRDHYYPVIRRARDNSDFFTGFYAKRYRAVALFGAGAEVPFVELWKALRSVNVAAGMLMRDYGYAPPDDDFLEKMREKIWEGLADPDAIATQVQAAVDQAEQLFRPAIEVQVNSVGGQFDQTDLITAT